MPSKKKFIWRDIVPTRGGGGKEKKVKCPNLKYLFTRELFFGGGGHRLYIRMQQSVSFLQAYLLLELISSTLLAETVGKYPLVFSVTLVIGRGRDVMEYN